MGALSDSGAGISCTASALAALEIRLSGACEIMITDPITD